MGDHSKIEWTDASWTPVRARNTATGKVGWHCVHMSEGCRFCYAEALNMRLGTGLPFKPGLLARGDVEVFLDEKMLAEPLRWRKPRMVFVCSMTDLFGDFVPDAWIDRVFAVMALWPQHTFQVLTKRPERMRAYMAGENPLRRLSREAAGDVGGRLAGVFRPAGNVYSLYLDAPWPLPNAWLGTSCEDQAAADERIPHLLATPAAVRFLSCEPLLKPINLSRDDGCGEPMLDNIDWVIVGGESGPGARDCRLSWIDGIREQCRDAGVPCFIKQLGAAPVDDLSYRQVAHDMRLRDRKGGDPSEWPGFLRVREMPA